MESRINFFVSGYYGNNNFGDDLMLKTVLEKVINAVSDAYFYIRNNEELSFLKNENIKYEETNLDKILFQDDKYAIKKLARFIRKYSRYIKECRYLIFGGGTVVHDNNGMGSLIVMFIMVIIAKLYGVKIYFVGIGVKHLERKLSGFLLNIILLCTEEFYVRDITSFTLMKQKPFGKSKVELAADIVYSSGLIELYKGENLDNIRHNTKNIGLTLNGNFLNVSDLKTEAILKRISGEIKSLINMGYIFKLFVLSPDDIDVSNSIYNQVNDSRISITTLKVSDDMFEQFYDMEVMISMRFHALVIATICNIPICGIDIDRKISDLCEYFQAPIFSSISELSISKCLDVYCRQERINNYKKALKSLQQLSNKGFSFIKEDKL